MGSPCGHGILDDTSGGIVSLLAGCHKRGMGMGARMGMVGWVTQAGYEYAVPVWAWLYGQHNRGVGMLCPCWYGRLSDSSGEFGIWCSCGYGS